jgi:hypothetical protein
MSPQQILSIVLSVIVLIVVLLLLRSYFLPEKYAVTWLLAAITGIVLSVFPQILNTVAGFFGIAQPINLLFVGAFFVIFLLLMQVTLELAKTRDELRKVVQRLGLEVELRADEKESDDD